MVCLTYKWQFTIKGSQGWNSWQELKHSALVMGLLILCSICSLCATQDHLSRSDPPESGLGLLMSIISQEPHSLSHRKTWWRHFSRQVSLSQMAIAYVMLPTKKEKKTLKTRSLYLMERKINTNIFSLSIVIQESRIVDFSMYLKWKKIQEIICICNVCVIKSKGETHISQAL